MHERRVYEAQLDSNHVGFHLELSLHYSLQYKHIIYSVDNMPWIFCLKIKGIDPSFLSRGLIVNE